MGTTLWLDKSRVAAKNKAELAEQAEAAEKGILRPKLSRQKKNKHIRQALANRFLTFFKYSWNYEE